MSLLIQIQKDQIQARKDRNTEKATFLTTLYSEAAMVGKNDGSRETTDAEVVAVVKKFVKNTQEVLNNLNEDDDRYKAARAELVIMNDYLPQQLTEDELRSKIVAMIEANNLSSMKDMGKVMSALKDHFSGQYDGGMASKITKELLA